MEKRQDLWASESVGSLTEAQRAKAQAALRSHPPIVETQVASRESVLEAFRGARGDAASRRDFVRRFFNENDGLQTAAYRDAWDRNHQAFLAIAGDIVKYDDRRAAPDPGA